MINEINQVREFIGSLPEETVVSRSYKEKLLGILDNIEQEFEDSDEYRRRGKELIEENEELTERLQNAFKTPKTVPFYPLSL